MKIAHFFVAQDGTMVQKKDRSPTNIVQTDSWGRGFMLLTRIEVNAGVSVLFSDERQLVSPETKSEQARRIFKSFDPEENNFISSDKLRDVLQALNLVNELE